MENNNIFERIAYVIEKEGLSISAFAKKIGVIDQTIRNAVSNQRSKPGYDVLSKIIQKIDWVDANWLMTGVEGHKTEAKEEKLSLPAKIVDLMCSQQDTIRSQQEMISNQKHEIDRLKQKKDVHLDDDAECATASGSDLVK